MRSREYTLAMRPSGGRFYCLGFIFDTTGNRVLLQKKRLDCPVEALRGTWNGMGGHVRPDELFDEAMKREALEESGMSPPWHQYATLTGQGWQMNVFSAVVQELPLRTSGSEMHTIFPTYNLAGQPNLAPYVHWLVPMGWDFRAKGKAIIDLRG